MLALLTLGQAPFRDFQIFTEFLKIIAAMFAYIDETANTGENLFDLAQPVFMTAARMNGKRIDTETETNGLPIGSQTRLRFQKWTGALSLLYSHSCAFL
jgi:hypothetical protein